jgi:hypothetical protein
MKQNKKTLSVSPPLVDRGMETVNKETALNVAVGQKISELLNLKFGRDGRTKTSWGTKSIVGLGACITRIVEEETERLKEY